MKWSIVTDSSCDYTGKSSETLAFSKIPFILNIDGKDYADDENLCVDEMIDAMEKSAEVCKSACPSPEAWYEKFMQAENCIAVTISAGVSGCFNAAEIGRQMALEKDPSKKIYVVDSRSAGSALAIIAEIAEKLIAAGKCFEEVVSSLRETVESLHTVFALSSFGNLIKNGRMSKLSGLIAGKFGIWGIGVAENGKIATKGKARGPVKALAAIIEDMKEHGYNCGRVVITHCQNLELASKLKDAIEAIWEKAHISILQTNGLCSFYAERGGLIVAYAE